jgi:hypothetical protein
MDAWQIAKRGHRAYAAHRTYDSAGRQIAHDPGREAEYEAALESLRAMGVGGAFSNVVLNPDPVFGEWVDNQSGHVHNWQTHVPDQIQAIWGNLGEDAQFALFLVAMDAAMAEEWD